MYHTIIVGGGIAGLYTQYKLLKKNSLKNSSKNSRNILLIEKNNLLGGRIYTHKVDVKGKTHIMEAGAGRFNDNHKLLLSLIKELGYKNKIIKIPSNINVVCTKPKWKNDEISKFSPYDYLDSILGKFKLKNNMKNISFENWLKKNIDNKIILFLKDFYPYKDIFKTNAFDALNLYKRDLNINNNFYILAGGLMQITEKLKKEILSMGGIIKLDTELKNIENIEGSYLINTNESDYLCEKLILTGQKPDLLKIKYLTPVKKLIDTVINAKLCRFYFIFDTKHCSWFKNIKKTITDTRLSYFIPINYDTGLVMISYVDEYNAKYLKKMEMESKNKLINYLLKECEKMFGIKKIPKPIWTKSFYWEYGVGNWKIGVDSKLIEKKISKPLRNENIFICGENYSSESQCWIEGSLKTAENVLSKIK